jgi:hypothetical protein
MFALVAPWPQSPNPSTLHRAELEVFADYHQFYIQDGGINPAAPTDWSEEDVAHRVKVAANVVVVCPVRNMSVPVEVEVSTTEPSVDVGAYDHVVRCSLSLPTGYLQVHECTGGERLRLSVQAGTYSVLVLFSALGSLSEDGLEGEDRYRIFLWPGRELPLMVVKAWSESEAAQ